MPPKAQGFERSQQELHIATEMSDLDRAFFNLQGRLKEQQVSDEAIAQLNPIAHEFSGGRKGPQREHLLLSIDYPEGGARDIIWYSPSVEPQGPEPLTFILKPGLGEVAEKGIGKDLHIQIANRNPYANIITHATQGFGPHASVIPWSEFTNHGLDIMAERALKLIHTYCPNHRLAFIPTSMGTIGTHKILHLDREQKVVPGKHLKVAGVFNYANALVVRERIVQDVIGGFTVSTAFDCAHEMLFRTSPREFLRKFRVLSESAPRARDIPLLARFIWDILPGVQQEAVAQNAREHPTFVISGERDFLAQFRMWEETDASIRPVPGGHGIVLDTKGGAEKITKTLDEAGLAHAA
jgi:hypothetical protein